MDSSRDQHIAGTRFPQRGWKGSCSSSTLSCSSLRAEAIQPPPLNSPAKSRKGWVLEGHLAGHFLFPSLLTRVLAGSCPSSKSPFLVVQVSHGAIHELVGSPLQCHDVCCLVQGQVPWDCLHVISLEEEKGKKWPFRMARVGVTG